MTIAVDPRSLQRGPTTGETAAIAGSAPIPRRRIGSSDLRVVPLALSGKVFGWTADSLVTEEILDVFRAAGGDFIDTADSYAAGRSEIMIGNWMKARRNRDDMVIATKIGRSADHPGLSASAIAAATEASLRRLHTDRVDLLYLHIDDQSVEFDETLLAVDDLIRAGKVRAFGGSDHTGNRLIEARVACAQLGVAPMVALQNQYHLMARKEYEGDLARVASQQGLGVMPLFALSRGFLGGRYRSRADAERAERGKEITGQLNRRGQRVLNALDRVAAAHDASLATIALAWLLSKPNVVAPVVSASSADQVFDLVAATQVALTRHEMAALDQASA